MADTLEPQPEQPEPANLRFLRRLVTVLTATMIFGLIAIFTVLVIRLQQPAVTFPEITALPAGSELQSLTRGPDYLIAVTEDGRAFILTKDGANIRQELNIVPQN